MSAGKYNIIIEQGATFSKDITLKDHAGVVINLTGATITSQIRNKVTDALPIIAFTVTNAAPTTGKFNIGLTATQTGTLSFKTAVYDVEILFPGGVVKRILEGSVVFAKEVTR